ncbi:hypothetical protein, partial [Staphylococcus capitis]|uniref:hypothetical protein n=1 Tax=Staphylococcus capitis TaxID=29388 RepID=UPI00203C6BCE
RMVVSSFDAPDLNYKLLDKSIESIPPRGAAHPCRVACISSHRPASAALYKGRYLVRNDRLRIVSRFGAGGVLLIIFKIMQVLWL